MSSDMDTDEVCQKFLYLTYATQCGGTNKYGQQVTAKTDASFTFRSRIRQCEDMTVDENYVVIALFILIGT
jgi:hypothetical protein